MLHEDRRGEEGRGIIRIRIDGWVYIGLDICDKEGVILIEKIISPLGAVSDQTWFVAESSFRHQKFLFSLQFLATAKIPYFSWNECSCENWLKP